MAQPGKCPFFSSLKLHPPPYQVCHWFTLLSMCQAHTLLNFFWHILYKKSLPSMPRMPHPNNINHAIYAVHCTVYTVQYSLPCSMCCPKNVSTDPPLLSAQHLCVPWFVAATDPKRHRNPVPIYHTFCHVKVKCLTVLVRGQFVGAPCIVGDRIQITGYEVCCFQKAVSHN